MSHMSDLNQWKELAKKQLRGKDPESLTRKTPEGIGVSSLAAGHKTLVPRIIEELKKQDASDIKVVVGGSVPPGDYGFLENASAAEIFGPGTVVTDSANRTLNIIGA